jgi:hypothetical protein
LRKAGWKARYHQEKRIQLHKSGGKYAFNARPFLDTAARRSYDA